jgi:tetratricopeptide (TPR) repeat protein
VVWEDVLSQYGPFDAPLWTFRTGRYYWRGALYRQALAEFQRLTDLLPGNATAQLWRDNMRVTAYFSLGDNALAEKLALELRLRSPRDDLVLETLTQIYMVTERYTNALASVEAQLQLDPDNERALLNQGALCIHLKAYEQALRPLDRLLKLKPDESAALMNRAIALLQTGNLDAAQRDYQLLQKKFPKYHAVYFGLGEIAYRRKDLPAARRNYESYLEYAPRDSAERKQITQRVQELKGGAAPR